MKSIAKLTRDLKITKETENVMIDYLKKRLIGKEILFEDRNGNSVRPKSVIDIQFLKAENAKFILFDCDMGPMKMSYVVNLTKDIIINGEPDTRRRVCEIDPFGEEDWSDDDYFYINK